MRPLVSLLCAALLAAAPLIPAQAAQTRARAKRHKPKAAAAQPEAVPRLTPAELTSPYSVLKREGACQGAAPCPTGGERPDLAESRQSNATSWKLDLSLTPQRPQDDSPLRFRLGREAAVDPLTKKELTPRADPLKAKQSLEELNLKGALENLGGAKGEVQVDVLKF